MAEKKEKSEALKRSWTQELQAEFSKITWPTKQRLIRETVAVVVVAVLLALIIFGIDKGFQYLFINYIF